MGVHYILPPAISPHIPSKHTISLFHKILILTFQNFNQSQKGEQTPTENILDYFQNNLKHFSYNLTLFHIFFNFLNHEIFFLLFISPFYSLYLLLSFNHFVVLMLLRFNMFLPPAFLDLTFTHLAI